MDTKLKWFQVRLIHRILPTNKFLFICKIKDSPSCTFCRLEDESVIHLFWDCPMIQNFWRGLESLLQQKCSNCDRLCLTAQFTIFGTEENTITDKIFDFIILLARFFIYKCKFKDTVPTIAGFLSFLRVRYLDEEYTARIYSNYDNYDTFIKGWMPYNSLM